MKRLTLKVKGNVQAVFFRWSVRDFALGNNLVGFARNESDGTVTVVAEGREEALRRLLSFIRGNPGASTVERVAEKWEDISELTFREFSVE